MKCPFNIWFPVVVSLAVLAPSRSFASGPDDAGTADAAAPDAAAADAGGDAGYQDDQGPLGCGGGICKTDPGNTACSIAGDLGAMRAHALLAAAVCLGAATLVALRIRARRAKERAR